MPTEKDTWDLTQMFENTEKWRDGLELSLIHI